jgi:hypothetical protein
MNLGLFELIDRRFPQNVGILQTAGNLQKTAKRIANSFIERFLTKTSLRHICKAHKSHPTEANLAKEP